MFKINNLSVSVNDKNILNDLNVELPDGQIHVIMGKNGIGKSTLILQLCDKVQGDGQVLYVSGEESAEQIKLRADRLRNKQ